MSTDLKHLDVLGAGDRVRGNRLPRGTAKALHWPNPVIAQAKISRFHVYELGGGNRLLGLTPSISHSVSMGNRLGTIIFYMHLR